MSDVQDKQLIADPLAIQRRIRSASRKNLSSPSPAKDEPSHSVSTTVKKSKSKSKGPARDVTGDGDGVVSVTVSKSGEGAAKKKSHKKKEKKESKSSESITSVQQAEKREKKRQQRKADKNALRETSFASGFDDESMAMAEPRDRKMNNEDGKRLASVTEGDDEHHGKHRSHDPPAMLKQSWDLVKLRGSFKIKVHECKGLAPPAPELRGNELSPAVRLDFTPHQKDWPVQKFKSPVAYYSGENPRFRWTKDAKLGGDELYLEVTVVHDRWYGDVVIGTAGLELAQLVRDNGRSRWWTVSRTEAGQVLPCGQVKLTCDYTPPLVLTVHRAKVIDKDDKWLKYTPRLYAKIKSLGEKHKTHPERGMTPEFEFSSFLVVVDKYAEFDPNSNKVDPTDVQLEVWEDVRHGINRRVGGALIPAKILWESIDQPAKWYEILGDDSRKVGQVQLSVLLYGTDAEDRRAPSRKEKQQKKAAAGAGGVAEAPEKKPKRRSQNAGDGKNVSVSLQPQQAAKAKPAAPVHHDDDANAPLHDSDDDLEMEVQKVLGPNTGKPAAKSEGRVVSVSVSGSLRDQAPETVETVSLVKDDSKRSKEKEKSKSKGNNNVSVSNGALRAVEREAAAAKGSKESIKEKSVSKAKPKAQSESEEDSEEEVKHSFKGTSAQAHTRPHTHTNGNGAAASNVKSPAATTAAARSDLVQRNTHSASDDDSDDDEDDAKRTAKPAKQLTASRRELMQAKRAQQKQAEEQRKQRRQRKQKLMTEPGPSPLSEYAYEEPMEPADPSRQVLSLSADMDDDGDGDAPL